MVATCLADGPSAGVADCIPKGCRMLAGGMGTKPSQHEALPVESWERLSTSYLLHIEDFANSTVNILDGKSTDETHEGDPADTGTAPTYPLVVPDAVWRKKGSRAAVRSCSSRFVLPGAVPAAWPTPQICRHDGVQARQWWSIFLYGYKFRSGAMGLLASLTQDQACQQKGCDPSIDNTPEQGWKQLRNARNHDRRTTSTVTYATDIRWYP